MNKLGRLNYLRCSSSENSDIESNELINDLLNYKISGKLDKRLLLNMEIRDKSSEFNKDNKTDSPVHDTQPIS